MAPDPTTAEGARLATSSEADGGPWKLWGPYLSERAWGTVREDYSDDGEAWSYFPHDHARSRAYRWSEDGMAGISDIQQNLCLALALWNGEDPIIKERIFGLTNTEGNHGEDVKEYWWYTDATPTHSWLSWRYHYPQAAFPYAQLIEENGRRTKTEPEFELLDTGIFDDDRYWTVTVDYAKAAPDDICMRITVHNNGPEEATLHVMPTVWFRNRWSWGDIRRKPVLRVEGDDIITECRALDHMRVSVDGAATWLVCDNETNTHRLFHDAVVAGTYPKDAVNDTIISGRDLTNPDRVGTKAAAHHVLTVASGGSAEIRVRMQPAAGAPRDLAGDFDATMAARKADADEFYTALTPPLATPDEALVLRQACAGMVWAQQFFHINVDRWLTGDSTQPTPAPGRAAIRDGRWRHLNAADVMSMPDPWEFPWFASWDLAFQCVALAHIDPAFAKHQLILLCREWFMHPNGQLPAYEWAYGDMNPPVHAWAALRVFEIEGGTDLDFLERIFHKLLINFTWWVNRTDNGDNNVFEGGFLGLDNIGAFDRSGPLPIPGVLEQSDATAWMAMYCANMLSIALRLGEQDSTYADVATKFLEHFAYISEAMNNSGMWSEDDGFYYDIVTSSDGAVLPLRVRSMVGLIPLYASAVLDPQVFTDLPDFRARADWFIANQPRYSKSIGHLDSSIRPEGEPLLLSIVTPERLKRIMLTIADPEEFLSPHGVRALSRYHRMHPFVLSYESGQTMVDYEPGESTNALFGGNSNWRGPVWMPVNAMVIESLRRYSMSLGDDFTIMYPNDATGTQKTLMEIADDLSHRLISLFVKDTNGRRPAMGNYAKMQNDPKWHDLILFHEYFHADTGMGLGASHQTGWTGLVLDLIIVSASNRRPPTLDTDD